MILKVPFQWIIGCSFALLTSCITTSVGILETERFETEYDPLCLECCEHNGNLSIEDRLKFPFFNNATKIQVISYSFYAAGMTPVQNQKINYTKTKEVITLSDNQTNELTDLLYNYNLPDSLTSNDRVTHPCYYPRHSIVFLDSEGSINGVIEICLECKQHKEYPSDLNAGTFCQEKYELLTHFFESIGIHFFEELEEAE